MKQEWNDMLIDLIVTSPHKETIDRVMVTNMSKYKSLLSYWADKNKIRLDGTSTEQIVTDVYINISRIFATRHRHIKKTDADINKYFYTATKSRLLNALEADKIWKWVECHEWNVPYTNNKNLDWVTLINILSEDNFDEQINKWLESNGKK